MIGHLVQAEGSPCPTLVLDARLLPREQGPLLAALADARAYLVEAGGEHVLKVALIEPSSHPMCDVDYRFVQALPAGVDRFDLRGSCGHSILAAVVAAERSGMVPALRANARIRVNSLNNDDYVVCEVDEVGLDRARLTVHFLWPDPMPVLNLLMTGEPRTVLDVDGVPQVVSLVSAGNPYAFVDAHDIGVKGPDELMAGGDELFDRLVRIRVAAAAHLGWSADGAFPKVAAVMAGDRGTVAVRAVSVPGWHPTIALTGATCLGAATRVAGTIPWEMTRSAAQAGALVRLRTPGGTSVVTVATRVREGERQLMWISIEGKKVLFQGSFLVEPLAHLQFEEVARCLASSMKST